MTDYSTTYDDTGAILALYGFFFLFSIIGYVISAYLLGRIYAKAGIEQWKAWVPVYNTWVFLELGGQKGWLSLLLFASVIPFVGWIGSIVGAVYLIIAAYKIGLGFGKEGIWALLYALLPIVWYAILAFDSSRWNGIPQAYGNVNNGYPNQVPYGSVPPQQQSPYGAAPAQPQAPYGAAPAQQSPYGAPPAQPQAPQPQSPYGQPPQEPNQPKF